MLKHLMNSGSIMAIASFAKNDDNGSKIDTAAVREAFESIKERSLNVSDDILELAISNCKNWADMDEDETIKFLEKVETETAKVSVADPAISAIVAKMDDAFHTELGACLEAIKKGKTTAVDMYAQFKRLYSKDAMNGWPYPGTDKESVPGNHRPDVVKKPLPNGDSITTVWTNDLVSAMPEGKAAELRMTEAQKELKTDGSVPHLKGKGKKELMDIISDASSERNALRSVVKRAIEFHHQWEAISGMPKIGIMWQMAQTAKYIAMPETFGTGKLGTRPVKVSRSPKPIWMFPADDPTNGKNYSVTQLLNFDVAKAIAAGGSMADLTGTAKKGPDTPPADPNGTGENMETDEAYSTLNRFITFFNKKENVAKVRMILADKSNPLRADWIENIVDAYNLIKPEAEKCQKAYEALKDAKIAALDEAATG